MSQIPPYGPQWQAYGPAPVPPKKSRRWPWVVGAVVLLLVFVSALSGGDEEGSTAPTTAAGAPRVVAPAAPIADGKPPAALSSSGPETSFGDGTYVVGEDVEPGTYKTGGAVAGLFEYCSVTTYSDDVASDNRAIDWKNGNANEPIRVKLDGRVKSVKASGCEPFEKVGA